MNPKPEKNDFFQKHEVEDYEKRRYRGLDQRMVHARERAVLRKMIGQTGVEKGFILDVPCGYGRFSEAITSGERNLVSSDLSFHMVDRAVKRSPYLKSHFGVVANAKRGLPFKTNTFEFILCMRFFHHVHDPDERDNILAEFARVTSRWVIVSYYQANAIHALQRKLRKTFKKSRAKISMIPRSQLLCELEKNGLRAVRITPLFRGLHAHHFVLCEKA
ncbi:MAG: class I SAM-dependent methyltransferase [Candidatus Aminicenantes bacterium]|nr:class I SAM-dependent methyltransferase [Candidatus Aminicenantes bacterium]